MKTVAKTPSAITAGADVIQQFGGLAALQAHHIHIENKPFLPLVIEFAGRGPRGYALVSVAHTYAQNGDLLYDPEMEFEVTDDLADGTSLERRLWRRNMDVPSPARPGLSHRGEEGR